MEKKKIFLIIFAIVVLYLVYNMGRSHGQTDKPVIHTPPPDPDVQMYDPTYLQRTGHVKRDGEFHKVKGTEFKRLQHDDYVEQTQRKKNNTLFYIMLGIGLFFMYNAMVTRDKKDANFRSNLDTNISQVGSQIGSKFSSGKPAGGMGNLAQAVEHNPEMLALL